MGEAQARQKLPFVGPADYDGVHRWTQMTLLLLGDPELRIFTGHAAHAERDAPGLDAGERLDADGARGDRRRAALRRAGDGSTGRTTSSRAPPPTAPGT